MKNSKAILQTVLMNPKLSRKKEMEELVLQRLQHEIKAEKNLSESLSKMTKSNSDPTVMILIQTYAEITKKHLEELQNMVKKVNSRQFIKDLEESKLVSEPRGNTNFPVHEEYEIASNGHYTLL